MSKRKADEMGMSAPPPEQPQRPQPQLSGAAVTVAAAGNADGAVRSEQSAALRPAVTESDVAGGEAEGETDGGAQCAAVNCGEPAAAATAASAVAAASAVPPAVAAGDDRTAALHHSTAADHSAAADPHGAVAAVTVAAPPVAHFDRLALVELQLIMRCCDQSTLIALARCSRFTLAAASHPFVWQPLSPIALQCDCPLQLSDRLLAKHSLLRHADISVTWRLRSNAAMSGDHVPALTALPRLRSLAVESAWNLTDNKFIPLNDKATIRLFKSLRAQIDNGGALTSLSLDFGELYWAGGAALAAFIQRSRTLTTFKFTHIHALVLATRALLWSLHWPSAAR